MSQAGTYDSSATPSPDIETLTGNIGGAVGPNGSGNIDVPVSLDTTYSISNNTSGAIAVGTPASNIINTYLTNRIQGSLTTTDATPTNIYTFDMGATAGVYLFRTRVVGYNTSTLETFAGASFRAVKTDGATGTLVDANTGFIVEENAMSFVDVVNNISGNDAIITITGIAGETINWYALTEYIFVGA